LLGLHGNYAYNISFDLQYILSLAGIQTYLYFKNIKQFIKPFLLILLWITIYYIGSIFSALHFELFIVIFLAFNETYIFRIINIAIILIVSVVSILFVYYGPIMTSYYNDLNFLNNLFTRNTFLNFYPFIIYFFLSFSILLFYTFKKIFKIKNNYKLKVSFPKKSGVIFYIYNFLIFCLIIFFLLISYDKRENFLLKIDLLASNSKWNKVIQLANSHPKYLTDREALLQINRALYYKGIMGDSLFNYKQIWSVDGLLPTHIYNHYRCLKTFSDICFELGYINQSLRWGYELIAKNGYSVDGLNCIIRANIANGKYFTAQKLIFMLEKTVCGNQLADFYNKIIKNPSNFAFTLYDTNYRIKPSNDFVFDPNNVEISLLAIFNNNPKNRMAFEYLITYCLLKGDLQKFITILPLIENFNFSSIPKHYQEAIILWQYINNYPKLELGPYNLDPKIKFSFEKYLETINIYSNDALKMNSILKQYFSNTYWYYYQFTLPQYYEGIHAMGLKKEGTYYKSGE